MKVLVVLTLVLVFTTLSKAAALEYDEEGRLIINPLDHFPKKGEANCTEVVPGHYCLLWIPCWFYPNSYVVRAHCRPTETQEDKEA